jgi:hypothetical protein
MNTYRKKGFLPLLPQDSEEKVILLEDLEFAMTTKQLDEITTLWNEGMKWEELAEKVKRNEYEILLALLHQLRQGITLRPFAWRG